MYGQTHAGLGWVIGVLPSASDRRLRAWCVAAALLPDLDAGAMIFGMDAYVRRHHKPGRGDSLLAPPLDRIFLNAFRKKPWSCATCGKPCNNECDACAKPACSKHGRINWRFRMTCPACALK